MPLPAPQERYEAPSGTSTSTTSLGPQRLLPNSQAHHLGLQGQTLGVCCLCHPTGGLSQAPQIQGTLLAEALLSTGSFHALI